MFDADHKRLQRERDIAVSIAPPNYTRLEGDIRRTKAAYVVRRQAQAEVDEGARQIAPDLVLQYLRDAGRLIGR